MVFDNVGKDSSVYPAIGLRHTSESIRVNFGHAPFKYAIEDHVHAQRNAVWDNIQTTTIDWNLLYGKDRKVSEEYMPPSDTGRTAAVTKGGALEEERMWEEPVLERLRRGGGGIGLFSDIGLLGSVVGGVSIAGEAYAGGM